MGDDRQHGAVILRWTCGIGASHPLPRSAKDQVVTATLPRPALGELAPTILLWDASGQPWHLEDQGGRNIVLIFHRHIH